MESNQDRRRPLRIAYSTQPNCIVSHCVLTVWNLGIPISHGSQIFLAPSLGHRRFLFGQKRGFKMGISGPYHARFDLER